MVTNITGIAQLITVLSTIKTPSFMRIVNYSNDKGNGEVANYTLNVGIKYENAKASDIEWLRDEKNLLHVDFGKKELAELGNTARLEMLASRINPSNRGSVAQTTAYETLCPNVRLHVESQRIYISGLVVRKDVVTAGSYKAVNSKSLTIAKKKIEKQLKATQFREFAFDKLKSVRVKGEEIEIVIA